MAKKNETMETPASSPTAGAKTKNSANALAAKLKTRRLRTVVGAVVFVGMAAGLIAGVSMGTMSGFGWDMFSMLCPLGALGTMIATKTMIPRAVVSLVLIAALVFVFGRAFCSWLCPTMLIDRMRDFFRSPKKRTALEQAKRSEMLGIAKSELGEAAASPERAKRVEGSPMESRYGAPFFCAGPCGGIVPTGSRTVIGLLRVSRPRRLSR